MKNQKGNPITQRILNTLKARLEEIFAYALWQMLSK